jgi:hypothetical protein
MKRRENSLSLYTQTCAWQWDIPDLNGSLLNSAGPTRPASRYIGSVCKRGR